MVLVLCVVCRVWDDFGPVCYLPRLMDDALMACAPPCSLFVGISSSVHMRSEFRLLGDTSRRCVRLSNLILSNFVTRATFSIILDLIRIFDIFEYIIIYLNFFCQQLLRVEF